MNKRGGIVWMAATAAALLGAPACPAALAPLFNGKDLEGWELKGGGKYTVQDEVIVGETGSGGHGWLCTKQTYGDFVLELDTKIATGNSGVQIRSHFGKEMVGYQIEIDPSSRAWSGGLYEQGRRGWLQSLQNNEPARKAFKSGEWNHYRIECEGDWIRSWINGVPAADYHDSMDLEGVIALQVHAGKNVHVEWKNIRLEDRGRHAWKPLWDGSSLQGWHAIGKGHWSIESGELHATHAREEPSFGHLVTDRSFTNFTVRLQYLSRSGNSGLYFRIEEKGFSGVSGFQAEIDATKDAGGLYETNGRNWVAQPAPEKVQKYFRPQQWNSMTVSAYGGRIAVDVNGTRSAELKDDPGRASGPLALQLHGGQDVDVTFKRIELLVKQ